MQVHHVRPAPPPPFSALWAREYNEVKALAERETARRTAGNSNQPASGKRRCLGSTHNSVCCDMTGRDITQNARLFAAIAQPPTMRAAVFEASILQLRRPVTAIETAISTATTRPSGSVMERLSTLRCTRSIRATTASSHRNRRCFRRVGTGSRPSRDASYRVKIRRETGNKAMTSCRIGNARVYDGVHYRTR